MKTVYQSRKDAVEAILNTLRFELMKPNYLPEYLTPEQQGLLDELLTRPCMNMPTMEFAANFRMPELVGPECAEDTNDNCITDDFRCCPDCETPNQFGELCTSCRNAD